jgi:cell wall assembly regulator SMI1
VSGRGVIDSWERIEAWLGVHAPQTLATLNGPADPAAVAEAEQTVGVSFPADLKASLARHDGAGQDQSTPGRFALAEGYGLMSLELTMADWRMFCELLAESDEEAMVGHWWHPQWIPVGDTNTPVRLIVDQRPGPEHGQVGEFLDEDGGHFGRSASFADELAHTADLLEGRVHDDRAVPRVVSGRLLWGWSERTRTAQNPRSVLTLAAEARQAETSRRAEEARSPAGPQPPAESASGRRSVTVSMRVIPAVAPPPAEPSDGPDWILDQGRCCLTFARGLTEAELIARFGGVPGDAGDTQVRTAEQAAAYEASAFRPMIRVGRAGQGSEACAFAIEQEHEEGSRDEVLRRLSAGTTVVSVAYDRAMTELRYAEDGVVVGKFSSRWPQPVIGGGPGLLEARLEQAGLLPLDPRRYLEDDAVAAAALAVSLGPGVFDPRVLRGPLPSAALLPLLDDPPDEPLRWPVQTDPDLVTAVEYATEDQLRPAVAALAGRRAAEAGLDAYPEIVAAVRDAAQGQAGQVPDDSPLGLVLRTLRAESNAAYADVQEQSPLLTDSERQAWRERAGVAEGIEALLARPAVVAAYQLAGSPEDFDGRQEFLDDLAGVTIPADAVPQLERAEEQRYEAMSQGPAWSGPRPSRRDRGFRGPLPIPGLGL